MTISSDKSFKQYSDFILLYNKPDASIAERKGLSRSQVEADYKAKQEVVASRIKALYTRRGMRIDPFGYSDSDPISEDELNESERTDFQD